MNRIIAKTAITALLLCAAALIACQKPALLTLSSPTNVELSPDGGNGTITFKANRDWTVRAADNWVRINPSSGTASDGLITVTLTADVNTTYEDRSTTVTIGMEGMTQQVTVKQPANTGLIVSKESVELSAEATTIEVEVQANIQFNVSVDADWIAQAGTKALTATKLSFSVARNESYNPRSATITISGGGLAKQVSVKQKGLESQDDPEVTKGELKMVASGAYFYASAYGKIAPYGYEEMVFEYDDKGRLARTYSVDWDDEYLYGWSELKGLRKNDDVEIITTFDETAFTAHEDTFETWYDKATDQLDESTRRKINAMDMVFDGAWDRIKSESLGAPWNDDYSYDIEYTYNAEGYLVSVTTTTQQTTGPYTETYRYEWKDGDLVKASMDGSGYVEIEYTQMLNPFDMEFGLSSGIFDVRMRFGFAGKRPAHLPKCTKSVFPTEAGGESTTVYYFLYEKDAQHRIVKQTEKEWDIEKGEFYPDTRNFWVTEYIYK